MYMNMGRMSNEKFLKFDLNDPKNLPEGMGGLADQMDPLSAFEEFGPALKSVTYVGADEVDGEDADHYTMVMDTTAIDSLAEVPSGAGVPEEVAYDAWFDEEFRFLRMTMTMDTATPVEMDARFFDWDEPVEIEAPPAGEVVEAPTGAGA
jgi:hypothetical protein